MLFLSKGEEADVKRRCCSSVVSANKVPETSGLVAAAGKNAVKCSDSSANITKGMSEMRGRAFEVRSMHFGIGYSNQ